MSPKIALPVYILICAVHFAAVVAVVYNPIFGAVIAAELLYYIIRRGRSKIFVKMLIISLIIGGLNLLSTGGRILLSIGVLRITEYGIQKAISNAALVFGLFLFTGNFFSEKLYWGGHRNQTILGLSMAYFRYMIDIIANSRNFKTIIRKIIVVYRRGIPEAHKEVKNEVSAKFVMYNIAAITIFILCIIFLIKNNKFA